MMTFVQATMFDHMDDGFVFVDPGTVPKRFSGFELCFSLTIWD